MGDQQYTAKNIYINVGTGPVAPSIEGLVAVNWLDSAGLLDMDYLLKYLIMIGGAYIGLEFGQVFKRLGSQVTIIQQGDQVIDSNTGNLYEISTYIPPDLSEKKFH